MRGIYGVQIMDRTRAKDLTLTLGLNEAIIEFVIANIMHCYVHLLRRRMVMSCEGSVRLKVKGKD